jgi:hypothetical protein
MTTLKIIALCIAAVVITFLVTAAITPRSYQVERSIVIQKPKAEVFEYIKQLKNQKNWSVWQAIDTTAIITYKGKDGKVGFIAGWDSQNNQVGKGEQEIKKIVDGDSIVYELRFERPFKSTSPTSMHTLAINDHETKVTWKFTGNMPYPMNIMLLVFDLENMISKDLDQGLRNLKALLEQ